MKIKELVKQIEQSIRADVDDSEGDLDKADFVHIQDVTKQVIDRCAAELKEEEV